MPCTHTQYGTATLLLEAGAGYVMTGKANQPRLPARVLNQINRVHRYRVMPHPTFRRPGAAGPEPQLVTRTVRLTTGDIVIHDDHVLINSGNQRCRHRNRSLHSSAPCSRNEPRSEAPTTTPTGSFLANALASR